MMLVIMSAPLETWILWGVDNLLICDVVFSVQGFVRPMSGRPIVGFESHRSPSVGFLSPNYPAVMGGTLPGSYGGGGGGWLRNSLKWRVWFRFRLG